MLFNNVVNTALADRNNLGKSFIGKLIANAITNECMLIIYPVNSQYVESSVGHYSYGYYKGNVERTWINHG